MQHGPAAMLRNGKSLLGTAWGWLFVTDSHLATLSQDEILARGLGPRAGFRFASAKRDAEDSGRELLARARSYIGGIARIHREKLRADIVKAEVRRTHHPDLDLLGGKLIGHR